jgi:hypothetical protein
LELKRRGVRYARLNHEELVSATVRLDPLAPRLEVVLEGVAWAVDCNLKSVWWRQPTFLRNTAAAALTLDEQLERSQWPAFLRGLMLFDEAFWMNDPAATYRAECKPWQLRQAHRGGFTVPATSITNDKTSPVAERLGDVIALKGVDTVLLREADQQYFAYTQLVPWADCADDALAKAPVIVQQALQPKLDLRVTVIGEQVWTVAILDQDQPIDGDWRLRERGRLAYQSYDLPPAVKERCVALVKNMGLAYGAIDLAVVDGEHVFIEINPTGEWGWLDGPDRPLAAAIAETLAA